MIPPALPHDFARRLSEFDPRLRARWDHGSGVWVVEERGLKSGKWIYVLTWSVKDERGAHHYRPMHTEGLLAKLRELDYERLGVLSERDFKLLSARMEGRRKEYLQGRRIHESSERRAAAKERLPYYLRGRRAVALNSTHLPT